MNIGDRVKKKSGSEWAGVIVGTYSTELTPEGYCVESSSHKGSVQIYPVQALVIDVAVRAHDRLAEENEKLKAMNDKLSEDLNDANNYIFANS